jgi:pectate lyase-like protein
VARLPVPGGDGGNWGNVLNDFLSTEHKSDGTLILRDTILEAKATADAAIPQSSIGKTDGVAGLGSDGKVPTAQLPASVTQPTDGSASTPSLRTLGTGATQAVAGTDSRLPDLASMADGDHLRWDAANSKLVKSAKLWFNVKDFGAVGDGLTDDSAAFIACRNALAATQRVSHWGTIGNNITRATMFVPPGEYVITTANALMDGQGTPRASGWNILGAGKDVSRIRFHPTDPGPNGTVCLMNNYDRYSYLRISDITFASTVSNATFMNSYSTGGVGGHHFQGVQWEGSWRYGFYLTGLNTNSEFTFTKCEINGSYVAFFCIPPYADGGNDQFLDYDFVQCSATLNKGNFIDLSMGGDVNIWGGSYSINGNGSSPQALLALRGGDHALGVCRALVIGARIELKHPLAQAVYCEWKVGNVNFTSVDMSALVPNEPETNITAEFSQSNGPGPNVSFDGCSLQGRHKYHISNSGFNYARRISYTNSDIYEWNHAADFIVYEADDTVYNKGSYPPIKFENCRSLFSDSSLYAVDCVLNWQNTNMGQTVERILNFQDAYGVPASGGSTVVSLPINAVITRVVFHRPAGSGYSGTSWSYTISDADNNVVATYAPGTAWNNGFHDQIPLYTTLSTDNSRTLTLSATGITTNDPNAKYVTCLMYYIA